MASSPITSWQIERVKVGVVTDFLSFGYKIILLALLSSLLDSYFSQLGKILGEFTVNVVLDLYGIVTGLLESVVFLQIVCG